MEISKNSWHFKLVWKWSPRYPKKDICGYMRQVSMSCIKSSLYYVFRLGGTAFLGWLFLTYLSTIGLMIWDGGLAMEPNTMLSTVFVIGSIIILSVAATAAFMIAVEGYGQFRRWLTNRNVMAGEIEEPKPNLLWEWIKAKNEKVCIQINFK